MPWAKRNRAAQILELQADGLSSHEIAKVFGMSPQWVQKIARQHGSPFSDRKLQYLCMRCKSTYVEGRWQRCGDCRKDVAKIGSCIGDNYVFHEI